MLIKKTIVLSDGANAVGHLSLVRVGSETGAKLTLTKSYDGAYIAIKLGSKEQENHKILGLRTEFKLGVNMEPNDKIGALILGKDGVMASGGIKEIVSKKLSEEKVEEVAESVALEQPKVEETEPKREETTESVVEEKGENTRESLVEEVVANQEALKGEEQEETVKAESIISPFKSVKGENFYRSIKGKLNEIMTANPREKKLEELIPDSKWVRVYYDKGEYYVVGVLTEDGEVTFLAYGVPGIKSVKPPKDAEELCDFVEVESSIGDGYWVMFQNAKNGEIMKSI